MRRLAREMVIAHYEREDGHDLQRLNESLCGITLTNVNIGLGDTVVLSDLPRSAALAGRLESIVSSSPSFKALAELNPFYRPVMSPFMACASQLNGAFDLGGGHLIQRIQRAYRLPIQGLPKGSVVPSRILRIRNRIGLHTGHGIHKWQTSQPSLRETSLEIIDRFIAGKKSLEFIQVGAKGTTRPGAADCTGLNISEMSEVLATCEYIVCMNSGIMHLAASLDVRIICILAKPHAQQIMLPVLKRTSTPELEWLYPQSVILHECESGETAKLLSLQTLEQAFGGDVYPYWDQGYLSLVEHAE